MRGLFAAGVAACLSLLSLAASVLPEERIGITVNGQPALVLAVEKQLVRFQIPWSAPADGSVGELRITKPDSPSWFGGARLFLSSYLPSFTPFGIAHQDFSSPVTFQRPARPGEIVHLMRSALVR